MNQEQREAVRKIGRAAFVREEMIRLGFWPPTAAVAGRESEAMTGLRLLYDELSKAQDELDTVTAQITQIADIGKLVQELRRKRIERVRARRDAQRQKRDEENAARRDCNTHWRKTNLPFLGIGVSAGLLYEGGDAAKAIALGLPELTTASELAAAIGITPENLTWLSYHRIAARIDHYHRFTIPKKRGGERVISSPKRQLRTAQNWILSEILDKLPVHEAATAFRPGLSIANNASRHAGKPLIVRIDLKDFFPSIGLRRVKSLFESLGYNEGVSTILALLSTETPRAPVIFDGERRFVAVGKHGVPQGACTSPSIANLVCGRMDARLTGASHMLGFTYTRYADDLVFSHPDPEPRVGMLLAMVRRIAVEAGFTINEEKTAVIRQHQRQTVTGLVVNRATGNGETHPRISRHDLRIFRAFLHQCDKIGAPEMSKRIGKDAIAYARGYLSYIHMVSPDQVARYEEAYPWLTVRDD